MSTAEKECRHIHKDHDPIGDRLIERHFELVAQARENGGIIGYDSKWITGVVTQLCIDLRDSRAAYARLEAEKERLEGQSNKLVAYYGHLSSERGCRLSEIFGLLGNAGIAVRFGEGEEDTSMPTIEEAVKATLAEVERLRELTKPPT